MSKVLSQSVDAIRKRESRASAKAGVMELIVPEVVAAAIAKVEVGEVFTFVGFAVTKNGKSAVRYTNDKRRTRTLVRAGCTDVKFVELPSAMTKEAIDASEFIAMVTPVALVADAVVA